GGGGGRGGGGVGGEREGGADEARDREAPVEPILLRRRITLFSVLRQQARDGGTQFRDAAAAVGRSGEGVRKRSRVLAQGCPGGVEAGCRLRLLHFVGLGEHHLIADCGAVSSFQ